MIRRIRADALRDDPPRPVGSARAAASDRSSCPRSAELQRAARRAALGALLADELSLAPSRVRALAARELARFRGAPAVELRVHPHELGLFDDAAELARELEIERLTVHPDPSLTRGGCTLHAERGELDARIETRIARMLALCEGELA